MNVFSNAIRTVLAIAMLASTLFLNPPSHGQNNSNKPTAPTNMSRVTPTTLSEPSMVRLYQQSISPTSLASRLYLLASDYFEGRETTTRGQKLAALYLASQYRTLGLTPMGSAKPADALSPAAYFQPFQLYRQMPTQTQLEVLVNQSLIASSSFSADKHDDLSYFIRGNMAAVSGGVVFAGYGIADDKLGYNDYAALKAKGISIDGKWVMILDDEPVASATTSLLPTPEHSISDWTNKLSKRVALLGSGKPAGVLEVHLESPLTKGTFAEEATQASLNAKRVGQLSLSESSGFPPTFAISQGLANQILASTSNRIEDLRNQIDKSLKPVVLEASGVTLKAAFAKPTALQSENVLAFIEGSDPKLKDKVLIISAHYDHLGLNPNLDGDQIFNGAADDGTGVVACLELAQAFMKAKRDGQGPRRSILFLNFSGEEKGLLGSSFYAYQQPIVPFEKTIANINMDGVGGIDIKHPSKSKNYIYISGTPDLSNDLIEVNKQVSKVLESSVELTDAPGFNSDNKVFQTQLIPYIYYSTGLTEHYHTLRDEPDTIDYEHLARVTQLIFGTAWQIANQDARPTFVDRNRMKLVGYICPPCGFECDDTIYEHNGSCPICGMGLAPKYK